MTTNPLVSPLPARAGRVTRETIQAHADWLNTLRFVKASGHPYFVANGENGEARLDRKI